MKAVTPERLHTLMPQFQRWGMVAAAVIVPVGLVGVAWRLFGLGSWLSVHSTALCGVMAIFCAVCVGGQEILLGPNSPNYPPGPWWVRAFLFFWMVTMAVRGTDILASLASPRPQPLAWTALICWAAQSAAQLGILFMIARQRRPSWFWPRAKVADEKAKAGGPAAAAAVLGLEGAIVAGPDELPEDTLDIATAKERRLAQLFHRAPRSNG